MKITLLGNIQETKWESPSMNRFSRQLLIYLKEKSQQVELIEPHLPYLTKFMPAQARFEFSRFNFYPDLVKTLTSDVFHITDHSYGQLAQHLDKAKVVITCHDLIPLEFEKDHFALEKFKQSISYLNYVKVVTVDSEATKKDLIAKKLVAEDKIKVVYLGRDEHYLPLQEDEVKRFKRKYELPDQPLILHVGNNLVYKNIETLLQALQKLSDKKIDFKFLKVGAGFSEAQKKLITTLNLHTSIIQLQNIPEEEMPALYNSASCLAYPSLMEGFGFPTLEALSCGTVTVISKGTSLEEIAGEAGIYVEPKNADSIAEGIEKALTMTSSEKDKLVKIGLERSRHFNWAKTADELIKIYQGL